MPESEASDPSSTPDDQWARLGHPQGDASWSSLRRSLLLFAALKFPLKYPLGD